MESVNAFLYSTLSIVGLYVRGKLTDLLVTIKSRSNPERFVYKLDPGKILPVESNWELKRV